VPRHAWLLCLPQVAPRHAWLLSIRRQECLTQEMAEAQRRRDGRKRHASAVPGIAALRAVTDQRSVATGVAGGFGRRNTSLLL